MSRYLSALKISEKGIGDEPKKPKQPTFASSLGSLGTRPPPFEINQAANDDDKLVIGNLLNSAGTAQFEVGRSAANELTDAGDRFAASAHTSTQMGHRRFSGWNGGDCSNDCVELQVAHTPQLGGALDSRHWTKLDRLLNCQSTRFHIWDGQPVASF